MKSDELLVEEALNGGAEAFAPIIDRYRDAVFGVSLARLGDFHEAEDAAQDAFVEAYQRLGTLRHPGRLAPWLRSIAIHRCIDRIRARRDVASLDQVGQEAGAIVEDGGKRDLRDEVMDAVSRLPKAQRETTALFYINGYSVDEVAAIQEVPAGTVKRRLHDARERLKEEMVEMVENTLKANAPAEDFAGRVFAILVRRRPGSALQAMPWDDLVAEIRKIGTRGLDGFVSAFASPYWRTRKEAVGHVNKAGAPPEEKIEAVIEMLKAGLGDANKKVRRAAVEAILHVEVDDRRKAEEFVPLVLPLLRDRSGLVRRIAAWGLRRWPEHVPLEIAARSLLEETHQQARRSKQSLLKSILAAREAKAKKD